MDKWNRFPGITGIISLEGMRFHAFHGVEERERIEGNTFEVSVTVHYPIARAIGSDNVGDTLDYAELHAIAAHQMATPSRLLENVAWRIAQDVAKRYPAAQKVTVKVSKLKSPIAGVTGPASVTVQLCESPGHLGAEAAKICR